VAAFFVFLSGLKNNICASKCLRLYLQANACAIMKARRDVYQAIADPTRRAIINMIASQPHNVNTIAANFDVTRQAISLHIQILADCGLINVKQQGRDRICEARLDQLGEISIWVDQYRQHWESKLDSLEKYVAQLKNERNGKQSK
jgi:DNA-binding transcriptional ArsR family regulator